MYYLIEWLNLLLLVASTIAVVYYYLKSVQPAKLEQEIGEMAYEKCERYRLYGSIPFLLFLASYVVYLFYPLPLPIPNELPWDYSISIVLAIAIAIPSFALMGLGVRAAGEETYRPKKEHQMYGGIYNKIRHPQSLGEVWSGVSLGLILNRTFLVLVGFIWFPIFYYFTIVEERDLILRYGQAYVEYRERVGMYFPKRAHKPESNKELNS
ncbi:MAG: isoprenylcysteine carboxylmethyltransferase family protein [Candidatus Thorarchaeota archaeon]|nr:isoprenylcysteine carboxylmethyltransferase family protein [Candidatus Thorarchaeota archaeon]